MSKSSLCDYSDAYILVKGTITVVQILAPGEPENVGKEVVLTNCALFTDCIVETNNTQIDNAKNIDMVMPIYNLIKYNNNYSRTWGSLRQYCRDEWCWWVKNFHVGDNNSASFKFNLLKLSKQKITAPDGAKDVEIMVPLKYLSNFWRTLEMPLINCEINLILSENVYYLMIQKH